MSPPTGEGINELLTTVGDRLRAQASIIECFVPYDRADVLAALHRSGEVLVEVHDDVATRVRARLPAQAVGHFPEFTRCRWFRLRSSWLPITPWASSRRRTRTTGCACSSGWAIRCPAASSAVRPQPRAPLCPTLPFGPPRRRCRVRWDIPRRREAPCCGKPLPPGSI